MTPERAAVERVVREAYAAYSAGEYDRVVEFLEPDVELVRSDGWLEVEPVSGREGFRAFLEPDVFEGAAARIDGVHVSEAADRAVVEMVVSGRLRGSEVEITQSNFHVVEFTPHLRVSRIAFFNDRAAAFKAAGFEPEAAGP